MEAIDVHFHIVPPRFVDLVRSGALREIVDVERAGGRGPAAVPAAAGRGDRAGHLDPPAPVRCPADPGCAGPARPRRGGGEPGAGILPVLGAARARGADRAGEQRRHGGAAARLPGPLLAAGHLADAGPGAGRPRAGAGRHGPGAARRRALHARERRRPGRPEYRPVLAMAARLGVPLFLHPQNAGDVSRLAAYHLWNLVGFPTESAIAASAAGDGRRLRGAAGPARDPGPRRRLLPIPDRPAGSRLRRPAGASGRACRPAERVPRSTSTPTA